MNRWIYTHPWKNNPLGSSWSSLTPIEYMKIGAITNDMSSKMRLLLQAPPLLKLLWIWIKSEIHNIFEISVSWDRGNIAMRAECCSSKPIHSGRWTFEPWDVWKELKIKWMARNQNQANVSLWAELIWPSNHWAIGVSNLKCSTAEAIAFESTVWILNALVHHQMALLILRSSGPLRMLRFSEGKL